MTTTTTTTTAGQFAEIRTLLAKGMAGVASANAAALLANEARGGAYSLFTAAAALSAKPEVFATVADELFAEIRVSSTVSDAAGNTYKVQAKAGKDGKGFVVPPSFSSAKSVITDALTRKVTLVDNGELRSFTAIRKDVQALREADERAAAKGDDRIRLDCQDMIAELLERAKDAKGADLANLYRGLRRVHTPPKAKGAEPEAAERGTSVADATDSAVSDDALQAAA
jgi:hypothetical protein